MPRAQLSDIASDARRNPEVFSTDGRIGRLRYWSYSFGAALLMLFVDGAAEVYDALYNATGLAPAFVTVLLAILSFIATVILARRRLQDLGKSAKSSILVLIPLVNLGAFLWLLFAPGDDGANAYGPRPEPNSTGVKIVGIALPLLILALIVFVGIPAYQHR